MLVQLSPARHDGLPQRSHHLVRVYRELVGGEVAWVQPYGTRLPRPSDLWDHSRERGLSAEGRDAMDLVEVPALGIEPLPLIRGLNQLLWGGVRDRLVERLGDDGWLCIGRPSRFALDLAERVAPSVRVTFDLLDDVPAFYRGISRRSMADTVRAIVARCDEVWVTTPELAARYAQDRESLLVPNACDPNSLPQLPPQRASGGLVYVGTVGAWFDWPWLLRIAAALPDQTIEVIGPVYQPPPGELPENVIMVGALRQDQAHRRMLSSRVGLVPFTVDALTDAVDPLKVYEYLACGLCVLATPTAPMRRHARGDAVWVAPAEEVGEAADAALAAELAPGLALRVRREQSWGTRFRCLVGGDA